MALPPSGTITIAMLAAEFGGSTPHSLSEYYRGGGLVPNIAANAAVPTSGAIALSNFYSATAASPVNFAGGTIQDEGFAPTSGYAEVRLLSDGSLTFNGNISVPAPQSWFLPNVGGIGASYWAKAVVNSGTLSSGPTTPTTLTGGLVWSTQRFTVGTTTGNITINVYSDAGGTILVCSGTFDLIATQSP